MRYIAITEKHLAYGKICIFRLLEPCLVAVVLSFKWIWAHIIDLHAILVDEPNVYETIKTCQEIF